MNNAEKTRPLLMRKRLESKRANCFLFTLQFLIVFLWQERERPQQEEEEAVRTRLTFRSSRIPAVISQCLPLQEHIPGTHPLTPRPGRGGSSASEPSRISPWVISSITSNQTAAGSSTVNKSNYSRCDGWREWDTLWVGPGLCRAEHFN